MCSVLFGASLASALKAKKTKKRNGKERHEKRIEKVKTAKKKSGSSRQRQEKNYRKLGERYAMSLGELSTKAKDLFGNDVRNVTRDELKEYAYALTEWRKLWSQVCRLNNLKNLEAAAVQAAPLFDGLKKFGERIKAKANVTTLLQTACDEFKRASEPKKLQWLRTAARVVMPRVEVLQIDALMAPRSGGFEKKPQTDAAQSEEEKVRNSIELFNENLFGDKFAAVHVDFDPGKSQIDCVCWRAEKGKWLATHVSISAGRAARLCDIQPHQHIGKIDMPMSAGGGAGAGADAADAGGAGAAGGGAAGGGAGADAGGAAAAAGAGAAGGGAAGGLSLIHI